MLDPIFHIFPLMPEAVPGDDFLSLSVVLLGVSSCYCYNHTMHGDCSTNKISASECNELAILLTVLVGDRACNHSQSAAVFKVTLVDQDGDKMAKQSESVMFTLHLFVILHRLIGIK